MKKLKEGEDFPKDFWNDDVNPIVGYYIKPQRRGQIEKVIKKYAKTPQKI